MRLGPRRHLAGPMTAFYGGRSARSSALVVGNRYKADTGYRDSSGSNGSWTQRVDATLDADMVARSTQATFAEVCWRYADLLHRVSGTDKLPRADLMLKNGSVWSRCRLQFAKAIPIRLVANRYSLAVIDARALDQQMPGQDAYNG